MKFQEELQELVNQAQEALIVRDFPRAEHLWFDIMDVINEYTEFPPSDRLRLRNVLHARLETGPLTQHSSNINVSELIYFIQKHPDAGKEHISSKINPIPY